MGQPLFILFSIIALGLLLGRVSLWGLSLGSSAVVFVALAAGHLGYSVPESVGAVGVVLFVYSVGLAAGPRFFRVFKQQGKRLAFLASVLVASGAGTAWLAAKLLGLPTDLAAGIFAGSMTSTPGLAAAMESMPMGQHVTVGYGIAYPFGVVGVVLFVQLMPRVFRMDLSAMGRQADSSYERGRRIRRVLVEVQNPAVFGKTLADLNMIAESNCQITRVLRDGRLIPIPKEFVMHAGEHVLLLGRAFRLPPIITLLGRVSDKTEYILDTERERMNVVATSSAVVGKSLGELRLLAAFGVTVARIGRHDLEFVPDLDDVVEWGDALWVVGESADLAKFAEHAGHRAKAFDQTDLISLAGAIAVGIIVGNVSFGVGSQRFALGLVGGPMLVALLLGHFGRIGRIHGSLPRASRLLMMEFGLVLFLAGAGVRAGGSLMEVIGTHGARLCVAAIAGTLVPLVVGYFIARVVLKMSVLQLLGGICGGMTSTPGLGTITAQTDSDTPLVSYAAAYPVALVLMTVFAHLLVSLLT